MLVSVIAGVLFACATIAIHGIGTSLWIDWLHGRPTSLADDRSSLRRLEVLCGTAVALLLTHMVEVIAWAIGYQFLIRGDTFGDFESSVYFSAVTFASLGYGDIVIEGRWRLLSAFQAMVGLLVFGWSTALLFALVGNMVKSDIESKSNVQDDTQ